MRGFVAGSLLLIALHALVQPGAAGGLAAGGGALAGGIRRLLSPGVAGVPQRGGGGGKVMGRGGRLPAPS